MKIFLINPPSSYESYIPPPGLSYLSAMLKKAGHEVYGFDAACPMRKLSLDYIENEVNEIKPDVIGVTLNLYFIRGGYELAKRLSEKNILLVAGGPHARVCPEETLNHNYNIVVNGEGEGAFLEVIDYVAEKKPLSDILGIIYKDEKGQVRKNLDRPLISNLDELPFMDRHLFPVDKYVEHIEGYGGTFWYPVFSSRGCPFNCVFCCVSTHKLRQRSVENVCDEIEMLQREFKASHISFMDDIFTANKRWLFSFLDELQKRKINISWNCESRVDTLDEDVLVRMKQSGCKGLFIGVESGNRETLKRIRKGNTPEKIEETLSLIARIGIESVKLNFMLGFPWENKSHILDSTEIIKKYSKRLKILNGIVVPIPYSGTELYNNYHQKYGFTDWWLKEKTFAAPCKEQPPYFKRNTLMHDNHWLEKNFFHYEKGFKRYLTKILLENRVIVYQSYYGFLKTHKVLFFSRLSMALYKISPKFERMVFGLLQSLKYRFLRTAKL